MKRRQISNLTSRDATEIYYALETKEKLLGDGYYGPIDCEVRCWRKHLAAIRRKIIRAGFRV